MPDVTVTVTPDGPYKVSGPIEIVGPNGEAVQPSGRGDVFLCRCGGSTNKPFCDGTHSKIGFQGAIRAVEESEGS